MQGNYQAFYGEFPKGYSVSKHNKYCHSEEQSDEESRFFALPLAVGQRFFASLRMT
jgi:hypothetical protein